MIMSKTLGEMTPEERREVTERALDQFQRELTASAPAISRIMDEAIAGECQSECPSYPGLTCVVAGSHDVHYALGEWWTEPVNIYDRTRTCHIDMSRGPAEVDASDRSFDVRAAVAREGWDLDLLAKLGLQAELELAGRGA